MVYHGLPSPSHEFSEMATSREFPRTWKISGESTSRSAGFLGDPDPEAQNFMEVLWLHEILSYCWSTSHCLRFFFFRTLKRCRFFRHHPQYQMRFSEMYHREYMIFGDTFWQFDMAKWKSPCLIAKYSINGPLSIAILNGVCMTIYSNLSFDYVFTE